MKLLLTTLALGAGLTLAAAASAEPWVDWSPTKGITEATTIKVEPHHIDDYLTGLSKTWVPAMEEAKKQGVIDGYRVMVKVAADGGPNVILLMHYPSGASLDPDKARDDAMKAAMLAKMSKEQGEKMVSGYDQYRTFVSDELWSGVDFPK